MKQNKTLMLFLLIGFIFLGISGFIFHQKINSPDNNHINNTNIELVKKGEFSKASNKLLKEGKEGLENLLKKSHEIPKQLENGNISLSYSSTKQKEKIRNLADDWMPFSFFAFIGIIFISIPPWLIIKKLRKRKLKEKLRFTGIKLVTEIQEIKHCTELNIGGKSPYLIIAHEIDPKTGSIKNFKSEFIWFDPSKYIKEKQKVSIFVDQSNYNRYVMDLSFLENKK